MKAIKEFDCITGRILSVLGLIALPSLALSENTDFEDEIYSPIDPEVNSSALFILPENQPDKLSFSNNHSTANTTHSAFGELIEDDSHSDGNSVDELFKYSVKNNVGIYSAFRLPEDEVSELEDKPFYQKSTTAQEDQSLIDSLLNTNYAIGTRVGITENTSLSIEWEKGEISDENKLSAGVKVQLD